MHLPLAARLYRLALRAFPADHRATYGSEMVDTFASALTERRRQGLVRATCFALAALVDTMRAGWAERRRRARRGRGGHVLISLGRDLVHAIRSLAKARTFSAVSVISLGIGIGTVMVILVAVRGFTQTPPGVAARGLVELLVIPQGSLRAQVNDWAIDTWTYPDFEEVASVQSGLSIAGWTPATALLRVDGNGGGARVDTMYVSHNYFAVLGVPLARGPGFASSDDSLAAPTHGGPQAIISDRTWRTRFDADPAIVGRSIAINGVPHTIVGVTPEKFRGHFANHRPGFELWLPLDQHPRLRDRTDLLTNRNADWIQVLGRLGENTTLADADGAVAAIAATLAARHPATNAMKSASVEPYFSMGARRRGDVVAETTALLTIASMVLLVVCLNMSGMVMVRSASRERELAVRMSIGASRARLVQYLLSEAVVLALLGGALATIVVFGIPAILAWWSGAPLEVDTGTDATLLTITGLVCLSASVVFGLLPAIRFSRPRITSALKDDGGGGRRVGRVHRATAAIQAGIAIPFLVIGAIRLEQIRRTATADLGFEPAGLFSAQIDVGEMSADPDSALRKIRERLERSAGITTGSASNGLPLDFQGRVTRVAREGGTEVVRAQATRMSPGHLETLGVSMLRGRDISDGDAAGSEKVVVITKALAERFFADGEPLGARVTFALEGTHAPVDFRWPHVSVPSVAQTFTIIGVADDVVDAYLGPPEPQVFVPLAQQPASVVFVNVRSSADRETMASAFEAAVRGVYPAPEIVRASVRTGADLVRQSRWDLAYGSVLAGLAGAVALLLAALGVFGVVGFMVATRTREIGIRIALGASRTRVQTEVLAGSVKLVAGGVLAGLGLAVLFVREISSRPLGAVEPLIYSGAAGIALAVALLAALPAARRAAAVEPIVAMRAE